MTVLQKIIQEFERGCYPANPNLFRQWFEENFKDAEEQQIRDAFEAGYDRAVKFGPNRNDYINNLNS